jgi:uncharacterized protein (TIGR02145 family)
MLCSKCEKKLEDDANFCPSCGTKVAESLIVSHSDLSTFTDPRDGRVYKTVKIGKQVWMAENLAYAAKDSKYYENSAASFKEYGRLYNWKTAMKFCPTGWHLPSNEEWQTLVNSIGGADVAAKKLKAKSGWNNYEDTSGSGTDDYGFAALPGGVGSSDNYFFNFGFSGYWWTASEYSSDYAYRQYMNYSYDGTLDNLNVKSYLFSVRCVRN